MTPPEHGRRRRRRRGQRQHADSNQARNDVQQAASESPAEHDRSGPPEQPRQQSQREGGRPTEGQAGGPRKRSRAKRRPNRQPMLGPMPSEVLKPRFRKALPTREMERLRLDDVLASGDEVQFGCPMLTRTRLALPSTGNVPSPRCSMGWALHSEDEVALCLRTPDLLDCWKLDEQREARLRAELEQESAAD